MEICNWCKSFALGIHRVPYGLNGHTGLQWTPGEKREQWALEFGQMSIYQIRSLTFRWWIIILCFRALKSSFLLIWSFIPLMAVVCFPSSLLITIDMFANREKTIGLRVNHLSISCIHNRSIECRASFQPSFHLISRAHIMRESDAIHVDPLFIPFQEEKVKI